MRIWWLLALAGCGKEAVFTPEPCDDLCIADPVEHCVAANERCIDDADCASGLTCSGAPAIPTTCEGPAVAAGEKYCHWVPRSLKASALETGFSVRSMNLAIELDAEQRPVLRWDATGATHVACGVFTCNPAIRTRSGGEEVSSPKDGEEIYQYIANSDACIVELHVTDAFRSSFVLGSEPETRDTACVAEVGQSFDRMFSVLGAACWAYDSYKLVAASDLVELDPVDYRRVARSTPASAECSVDDTPCYESEKGFFGSCVSGTCQPRCVTAQDCELADRALGGTIGGSLDATCQWTCRALPRSRAGVCERL